MMEFWPFRLRRKRVSHLYNLSHAELEYGDGMCRMLGFWSTCVETAHHKGGHNFQ